jgi:hypothetical protein
MARTNKIIQHHKGHCRVCGYDLRKKGHQRNHVKFMIRYCIVHGGPYLKGKEIGKLKYRG